MNLYLVRHSIAESFSVDVKDFDRNLTEEGKAVINKVSTAWKNYIKDLDVILTSPLVRAVQTAEMISKNLQANPNIIKDNNLGTGSRTADLIDLINSLDYKNVMVVGHQPDLSIHLKNLCSNGSLNVDFQPATLAQIEFGNSIKFGKGILNYLVPPIVHLK